MKKKVRKIITITTTALLSLMCVACSNSDSIDVVNEIDEIEKVERIPKNPDDELRGAWISTVYNADFPTVQNNVEGQKAEFIEKIDQLQSMGINSVMVQVRPKGDAYYKSELNPWSATINGGAQGVYPDYDVMQFMIEETHKRDMEFHAWLNPYRITTYGTDLNDLSKDNQARINPDWVIQHENALYYNPELDEVKQYIVDTVQEIVLNYNVDGIHFDDYFYPSNYPLTQGEEIIEDDEVVGTVQDLDGDEANERREHINDMVETVYHSIKEIDSDVVFGISPIGIWKNIGSDLNGSNTTGGEGFYNVFADALAWIDGGYIDYIAPQIYWEQGNKYADYETLVEWWDDKVYGTDIKLYIGQAVYKDIVASEITEQLDINREYFADGSIFFSTRDLIDNREGCADAIRDYYIGIDD